MMMTMFGPKGKKMTKLEKACVAFVIALGERMEEINKRLEQRDEELRVARNDLSNAEIRAERAEAEVCDLKAKLAERGSGTKPFETLPTSNKKHHRRTRT